MNSCGYDCKSVHKYLYLEKKDPILYKNNDLMLDCHKKSLEKIIKNGTMTYFCSTINLLLASCDKIMKRDVYYLIYDFGHTDEEADELGDEDDADNLECAMHYYLNHDTKTLHQIIYGHIFSPENYIKTEHATVFWDEISEMVEDANNKIGGVYIKG